MIPSSEISFQDCDRVGSDFQHVIRRNVKSEMDDFHASPEANGAASHVSFATRPKGVGEWGGGWREDGRRESLFLIRWIRAQIFWIGAEREIRTKPIKVLSFHTSCYKALYCMMSDEQLKQWVSQTGIHCAQAWRAPACIQMLLPTT